jgi:hypothetical protein
VAGAGGARGLQEGPGQPVVVRALSLLEQFTERRRALSLSELARLAGLAPATALRLVRHLTEWGALERLEDGRYVVGVRLWEIASLSPRGHGVRQIALPYLEDLYEVTRHHVLLSVRDGSDAVLIDRLSSRNATEVAYRVGGRMPLRTTAVGQVLLAYSAPRCWRSCWRGLPGSEKGRNKGPSRRPNEWPGSCRPVTFARCLPASSSPALQWSGERTPPEPSRLLRPSTGPMVRCLPPCPSWFRMR